MRRIALLPALLLPLLLAACATGPGYSGRSASSSIEYGQQDAMNVQNVYYGRVMAVRPVEIQRQNGPGLGAVLGAVIGGVVGNQIGSGSGRTLATVGGAVAGGFAGNGIQNANARRAALEITVRLDDGHDVAVVQDADVPFYPGDRVRVLGYGQNARVTHR
jgi:outer membrane lipoprotein SlyB